MTANELFKIEYANKNEIHLFKAGMFWQAWEKSAFFFVKNFENYEVKARYIKKIGAEMVYLGFPDDALAKVLAKANLQHSSFERIDDRHVVIRDFQVYSGYESWKSEKFNAGINKQQEKSEPKEMEPAPDRNLLAAYKETYESVKYIFTRTGETSKLYRYGLGDKLRGECLDFLDIVNCANLSSRKFEGLAAFDLFCRIRIKLRMLLDFHEISEKQWFYINERLENIKKLLRLESFGLRFNGAC